MSQLAEVDRLMPEGSLTSPPVGRGPDGRIVRAVGGEWDWYYQLADHDRRRILRHCQTDGIEPDVCAAAAGYDDLNEWAADLVGAVLDSERHQTHTIELVDPADLVGPAEVADLLGCDVATVRQWHHRGILPAELVTLSGIRLWDRADIEAWALATNRLATPQPVNF